MRASLLALTDLDVKDRMVLTIDALAIEHRMDEVGADEDQDDDDDHRMPAPSVATVRAVAPDNVIAPVQVSLSRCGRVPWSR